MTESEKKCTDIEVRNVLGFHVRPVQRFAEMARVFRAEVEVGNGQRTVPGKSVMNLMSLGLKCGDALSVCALGDDADQCVSALSFLAEHHFFVEDEVAEAQDPERHVHRLAGLAACFQSDVSVEIGGAWVDAKDSRALQQAGLRPQHEPELRVQGPDAEQARAVLENLIDHCYYVEQEMIERKRESEK